MEERYSRQVLIPGFGEKAQRRLRRAHAVVVGLGGLGCPSSLYLVAAGVGRITLVDSERVEESNLNRQVLHWTRDVGRPKAESAAEKLGELNPEVRVEVVGERLTEENAGRVLRGDVVVDGLDNYETRYLVNSHCVRKGVPFVHAAVEGLTGQLLTVLPGEGPCLRCLIPEPPPPKPVFPVLGATAGVMGCLQAMEVIKLLTGVGKPLVGRLLLFEGKGMTFEEVEVRRNPGCPVCGGGLGRRGSSRKG
ncbi:MAG: HesA/MoeB/ThiF family protein [Candidatus Hadarchaeales archaeon]